MNFECWSRNNESPIINVFLDDLNGEYEGDEIEEEGAESENSLENESGTDTVNPNTDPDTETDSSE